MGLYNNMNTTCKMWRYGIGTNCIAKMQWYFYLIVKYDYSIIVLIATTIQYLINITLRSFYRKCWRVLIKVSTEKFSKHNNRSQKIISEYSFMPLRQNENPMQHVLLHKGLRLFPTKLRALLFQNFTGSTIHQEATCHAVICAWPLILPLVSVSS